MRCQFNWHWARPNANPWASQPVNLESAIGLVQEELELWVGTVGRDSMRVQYVLWDSNLPFYHRVRPHNQCTCLLKEVECPLWAFKVCLHSQYSQLWFHLIRVMYLLVISIQFYYNRRGDANKVEVIYIIKVESYAIREPYSNHITFHRNRTELQL